MKGLAKLLPLRPALRSQHWLALSVLCSAHLAARPALASPALWNDLPRLYQAPQVRNRSGSGLETLEFESIPHCGGANAWNASYYGAPADASAANPVPAVVNLHGGGCDGIGNGQPLRDWVEAWVERGYAAISISAGHGGCDNIPITDPKHYGIFYDVADAILATSLLRSLPEVAADRIGLAGVSWGGHKSALTSAIDTRLRFVIPIYGGGFMDEEPQWRKEIFDELSPANEQNWLDWFDPKSYLAQTTVPTLWLTDLDDQFWGQVTYRKSFRLVRGPRVVSVHRDFGHGCTDVIDNDIEDPFIFAKSIVGGGVPLTAVGEQGITGTTAWARFQAVSPVVRAFFSYTRSTGPNPHEWQWESTPRTDRLGSDGEPAKIEDGRVTHDLPADTTRYYFSLEDEQGGTVTTDYIDLLNGETGAAAPNAGAGTGGLGGGGVGGTGSGPSGLAGMQSAAGTSSAAGTGSPGGAGSTVMQPVSGMPGTPLAPAPSTPSADASCSLGQTPANGTRGVGAVLGLLVTMWLAARRTR